MEKVIEDERKKLSAENELRKTLTKFTLHSQV